MTEAAQAQARHPRAWVALAILFMLVVLAYVDRMTIVLMVEPIKHDLGISDVQISYLQGLAFALCFALAGPPLAWVADRYSRVQVIFWGVAIWSLATMASGMTSSYSQLLGARFLVGVGEAALMPAAFSLLADLFPYRQRALAFGIVSAGAAVGGAAAMAGGGYLLQAASRAGTLILPVIGEVQPWQLVFIAAGLPGIAMAALVFLIPDVRGGIGLDVAEKQPSQPALLGWVRTNTRFVLLFSLAVTLLCAIAYGITNWAPSFFVRSYGLQIVDFAFALAVIQLIAGVAGYVGGGHIADRLTLRGFANAPYVYLAGVSILLLVAGLGAFTLRAGPAVSLAFLALFHLVLPYTGIVAAELQLAAPRHLRAQVIALVTAIYTLFGMVIGPTSIAWLTEHALGDAGQLATALTIATATFCPLALLSLLLSRKAASTAIATTRAVENGR
ncbi:MFS transporter [Sphingomonas crocodyli]|uniref:MFS transporter n=1 Tax=Sphingomonas crocodyli TaxID=1979270 RepID=A0A437M635_9SPHN|nr:MFS transporter [Sphingomonas crocodyli]RVT93043.1 MFS transporter [Sphingomonas crocodyli]